jgi:hypothetical protein
MPLHKFMPETGSGTIMVVHADTRAVVITYALKGNTVYVKPYM